MKELERRQIALVATLNKYRKRPLDYRTADCVRMIRFHLLQMGHKPPVLPRYQSFIGARRAVKAVGGIDTVLDTFLPRITPARMLPGDIALLPGTDGMDCAVVSVGHKVFGWHEAADHSVNMEIPGLNHAMSGLPVDLSKSIKAAWRV